MSTLPLTLGFIPLTDAAPLIIAHEIGFAEEEGLIFDLRRAPSWSTLRDMVALGQVEAAHMLAPVPVASALGLGGLPGRLDALSVLSVNGTVFGVSNALAKQLRDGGHAFDFADAVQAGKALIAASADRLRLGVPFPFSMHAELSYYWLGALGLSAPQALDVRTIPPPLMADALAAGEIDAFCVGEPWGSKAVDNGTGELLLPGSAIWAFAPEKVLAVRHDWAEAEQELTGRLIRTLWRAGKWLDEPGNRRMASEILARAEYLNVAAEVLERALTGHIQISSRGAPRSVPGLIAFHDGAATFPWRSQAAWIADRLAARTGLDRTAAAEAARATFRTDLYRQALGRAGATLPAGSDKLEGSLGQDTEVQGGAGTLILRRNAFFDGSVFDPEFSE